MSIPYKNFNEIKEHKEKIEKELSEIDKLYVYYHNEFKYAIQNNKVSKIKEILNFGFDIDEKHKDYSSGFLDIFKFSNIIINVDTVKALLINETKGCKKIIGEHYLKHIVKLLTRPAFDYDLADHLEFSLTKFPHFFNSISSQVLNQWGDIPFTVENHPNLHQYVLDVLNKDHNFSLKNIFTNTSKSDNGLMSHQKIYSIPEYQILFDELIKNNLNKFKEIAFTCMNTSVKKGNMENINFWLSFYIPLPNEKRYYSELVQEYKKENILEVLSFILENTSVCVGGHVMLKTAMHYQKTELIKFLLERYKTEQLFDFRDNYQDDTLNKSILSEENKILMKNTIDFHCLNKKIQKNENKTCHKKIKI